MTVTAQSCPTDVRWRRTIDTPAGAFRVQSDGDGLRCGWGAAPPVGEPDEAGRDVLHALRAYFSTGRADFSAVPTPDGPPFHRACWEACRTIAPGATWTYAELAARAGRPGAARAAGQAMRRNPLPVVVPCHRVVGSDGALHGYAGSVDPAGDPRRVKRWLLDLEAEGTDPATARASAREEFLGFAASRG